MHKDSQWLGTNYGCFSKKQNSAVRAGDAAASPSKFFFGQIWVKFGQIRVNIHKTWGKILHPQKHSFFYGYK